MNNTDDFDTKNAFPREQFEEKQIPQEAMEHVQLVNYVEGLILGDTAYGYRNLTMIPVFANHAHNHGWITLPEAIAKGAAKVREISSSGKVNTLLIDNEGAEDILILDGEPLCGGKQNRATTTTVYVPAGTKVKIPVTCTERKRWKHTTSSFENGNSLLTSSIRRKRMQTISRQLRNRKDATTYSNRTIQQLVWQDIQQMKSIAGCSSPTESLEALIQHKSEDLLGFVKNLRALSEQIGSVWLIGHEVLSMEILACPRAYSETHHRIVRSAAMEALLGRRFTNPGSKFGKANLQRNPRRDKSISLEYTIGEYTLEQYPELFTDAANFAYGIRASIASSHESAGLGKDLRLNNENTDVSALVVDSEPVHILAFRRMIDEE